MRLTISRFRTGLLALLLLATSVQASPRPIRYGTPDVTLSIPDGLERAPFLTPRSFFSFRKSLGENEYVTINGETMDETLPRGKPELERYERMMKGAPGMETARFGTEEIPWKSFSINVIRTELIHQGREWLILQAQVPLEPEAIAITVGGPKSHEKAVRDVLGEMVNAVDGSTNWGWWTRRTAVFAFVLLFLAYLGLRAKWLLNKMQY